MFDIGHDEAGVRERRPPAQLCFVVEFRPRGHAEAQLRYAEMYAEGQGLDQDDVQAYKWLTLAAKRTSNENIRDVANKTRNQVSARMSAEQRQGLR